MKKAAYILLILLIIGTTHGFGADLESLLKKSLNALYTDAAKPMVICFGNFTYADKNLGSEFSRYLENYLSLALKKCPQFELFAKDKLEEIMEAQELALSDLFSSENTIQMGNLKSIRAMLAGRFFDTGANVEVFLELLNIETGTVTGSVNAVIPKSAIPKNISLTPGNYDEAVALVSELEDTQPTEDENLVIKAWTKRGDGGTYVDGEELVIHFYANQDCFIKLYHIDVNGNMKLIFPNQYHKNNLIKKDTVYTIPDESYGFAFQLGKPYGTEFIKVIASTQQFKEIEDSFKDLGRGSEELIERGLSVAQRKVKLQETMLRYTIIEK